MPFIDGVTTNPTLAEKEGRDFRVVVGEICKIVHGPVSVEAVSLDCDSIVSEAHMLSLLAGNIVVKIPITPEGIKAVSVLSKEWVKTNVTLVFSANQALLAAKAGATYVSPFVGRLDDIGHDGIGVVADIIEIFRKHSLNTQVIAASIRHPMHVLAAAKTGCHVATVPFAVLQQMFRHALTDAGIKRFLEDWEKLRSRGA